MEKMISFSNKRILAKTLILTTSIILLTWSILNAQVNKKNDDRLDTEMKNELIWLVGDSSLDLSGNLLTQIPLRKCDADFAYFSIGNIINYEAVVTITARLGDSIRCVDGVSVLAGRYRKLFLPDSAFADICAPRFCPKYLRGRKARRISQCKVFRSADKRRVYIYLPFEKSVNHAVTWIIQDKKYYGRVITDAPMK